VEGLNKTGICALQISLALNSCLSSPVKNRGSSALKSAPEGTCDEFSVLNISSDLAFLLPNYSPQIELLKELKHDLVHLVSLRYHRRTSLKQDIFPCHYRGFLSHICIHDSPMSGLQINLVFFEHAGCII